MDNPFDSHSRNFGELVGQYEKRRVVVPQFQRGYSWEKTHFAAFWADLLEFHNHDYSPIKADKYFLGPIVILPQDDRIILLDGQQRLATATIFFSALRDIARSIRESKGSDLARDIQRDLIEKDEGQFSLELSEMDATFFLKTVQKDPPDKECATLRSHFLIKSARDYLHSMIRCQIEGLKSDEAIAKLKSLKDAVASGVTMVAISVLSEDDAFKIFETLNDRGLRLSVPDLLLNYLMRTASGAQEKSRIREKWNFMLERIGRRDIDRFLRHMWLSKYGDVKARGLFSEIKDYLNRSKIHSVDFADSCAEECEQYVAIIDLNEKVLRTAWPHVAGLVKYLEVPSSLPLLLSGLRCLNSSDFEKLARMTIGLVVRHSLLSNLNPTDLETAFYHAAREIRAQKQEERSSARCLHEAKAILAKINLDNSLVEPQVENLLLTRGQAHYIMTTLANKMQSRTREIAIDDANLEHIFPLNPSPTWQDTAELEPLTWHIGNLTILGTRLNRQAANGEFKVKAKKHYATSEIKMTSTLTAKYKEWTKAEVLQRARELAPLVVRTWPGP
jgi:hypothetical protein